MSFFYPLHRIDSHMWAMVVADVEEYIWMRIVGYWGGVRASASYFLLPIPLHPLPAIYMFVCSLQWSRLSGRFRSNKSSFIWSSKCSVPYHVFKVLIYLSTRVLELALKCQFVFDLCLFDVCWPNAFDWLVATRITIPFPFHDKFVLSPSIFPYISVVCEILYIALTWNIIRVNLSSF